MERQIGPRAVACPVLAHRVEWTSTALVTALALTMRIWFLRSGAVANPMVGDAAQYFRYAWNLVHFATFSMSTDNLGIVPDSFRDPGYPIFLAGLLALQKSTETWCGAVLLGQALMGALSATLTILIARRWLGHGAALFAGLAVAMWPHNVSISGFLLSESLLCFTSLMAIWLFCRASESAVWTRWLLAGFAFGVASLVSATMTPFVLVLTALLSIKRAAPKRLLLTMLLASLVLPGLWAIRASTLGAGASSGSRAMMNLVEGSWPEYHSAYFESTWGSGESREKAAETMQSINEEVRLASKSPIEGLSSMFGRFRLAPAHYFSWYAWKPGLFWAWNIRMGWGDVYPYPILHPLYVSNAPMRVFESLCVGVNPILFALMSLMILIALTRFGRHFAPGLYAVALVVFYETGVYTLLQSEPRYSIPFRPLQMILAVSAICWLWGFWANRRMRERAVA